jgi:hypothetical protein
VLIYTAPYGPGGDTAHTHHVVGCNLPPYAPSFPVLFLLLLLDDKNIVVPPNISSFSSTRPPTAGLTTTSHHPRSASSLPRSLAALHAKLQPLQVNHPPANHPSKPPSSGVGDTPTPNPKFGRQQDPTCMQHLILRFLPHLRGRAAASRNVPVFGEVLALPPSPSTHCLHAPPLTSLVGREEERKTIATHPHAQSLAN